MSKLLTNSKGIKNDSSLATYDYQRNFQRVRNKCNSLWKKYEHSHKDSAMRAAKVIQELEKKFPGSLPAINEAVADCLKPKQKPKSVENCPTYHEHDLLSAHKETEKKREMQQVPSNPINRDGKAYDVADSTEARTMFRVRHRGRVRGVQAMYLLLGTNLDDICKEMKIKGKTLIYLRERFQQSLSPKEIAVRHNVAPGTVSQSINRALEKIGDTDISATAGQLYVLGDIFGVSSLPVLTEQK